MNIYKYFDITKGKANLPLITKWLLVKIQGYNHSKYWERRKEVVNPVSQLSFWIKLYYLYYIKKVDAKHQCSFGTSYNSGAYFATPPLFLMDQMVLLLDMMQLLVKIVNFSIRLR